MKLIHKAAVAGLSVAAMVAISPPAHAVSGSTVTVRPGDFVSALSDTRATGHVEFLKDGLHVWTEGATSTDKAAEYVGVSPQAIPSSVQLNWFGTQPQPGSQIVFDFDQTAGNGNDYNILVGEPVYNDPDGTPTYWLTNSSSAAAHGVCPRTIGGSGSACWGTLAQWQQAAQTANVGAIGFSLGSGVKGDGVLRDIQVGDTDYEFTNAPATTVIDVTGTVTVIPRIHPHAQVLKMHFVTDALGANQVQGHKLRFKVVSDGKVVYRNQMGAKQKALTSLRFNQGTGKHKVVILKNGVVVQGLVLKSGH